MMDFYDILLARNLSGGGGEVTPESIVTATGEMTAEQAAQTRENIGAGEPLSPQDIADAAGDWLADNLATPSTPPIDASLSVANAAADAKATGDALATKADTDGEYDTLTAGAAKQLESTVGITDNAPYLFRTAGGSADIGDLEMDKLVGGTVCWNQKLNFASPTTMNQTYVSFDSNTGIYTITFPAGYASTAIVLHWTKGKIGFIKGHVYYSYVKIIDDTKWAPNCFIFRFPGIKTTYYQNIYTVGFFSTGQPNNQGGLANSSTVDYFSVSGPSTAQQTEVSLSFIPVVIDVTQLLGPDVANALAAVTDNISFKNAHVIKELFPRDYYTYNAGTLLSVKALSHDMVGFNAYDHTAGQAKVVGGNVYQITGAYTALSLDGEAVTPDADGYFTPANSGILTVTGGNTTTTCVHLKWDGEKDGEWEPYVKHSYPLDPDLELRGIPMLDANGELYYDGDTYESDGTVTRKFGIRAYQSGDATDGVDMVTDGTNTVYRLTTPTTEQAAPFRNPQQVDDFGTEEYVDTRTVPLPVGHTTFYQANLRAKLEMSPNSPDGDGDYIVRQTDGENEYVPLVVPPCMVVSGQDFTISPGVSVAAGATYNTYSLNLAVETQSGYTAAFAYITGCNGSDFATVKAKITDGVLDATVCNISANAATLTEIHAQIIYTRTA